MSNTVHKKSTHVINVVVLIIKQFIFKMKCQGKLAQLTLNKILLEVKEFQNVELYNAKINCKTEPHRSKWSPVSNALSMYLLSEGL